MAVLNITPDSFSDGGQFLDPAAAVEQALALVAAGADLLDLGGQSTRPGATPISPEAELARVLPVLQAIRPRVDCPISIDTTSAQVAEQTLTAGADLINDVSGGTYDPDLLTVVAQWRVPVILMHLRGTPRTMQTLTDYDDLVGEVTATLRAHRERAAGRDIDRIILDPGLGFAKTGPQNLELLRRAGALRDLGCPLLIGPSRKRFIGEILDQPDPQQRDWGTAAACCAAVAAGADLVRVHQVAGIRDAIRVADALWRPSANPG
ncbi:MAG: dihydropteroate synthase [Gloeomargaritaceae cyanobacterium C42_A2020_066]|nr:dihydropteroate synthase [Gloeomargaritaceae cyanobacterium C42_A2020_066]